VTCITILETEPKFW